MPTTTESIRLRVRADVDDRDTLRYVQYATEIPIAFVITDYTIPDGAEARFYIRKTSGKEVYQVCEIDGQKVILHPTAQTFAEYGWQSAQLQIVIEDKVLVSYIIKCNIERNLITEFAVESQTEFSILDELIDEAREAISESEAQTSAAKDATDAADQASKKADTAADAAQKAAEAATQVKNEAEASNAEAARHEAAAKASEDNSLKWSKYSESYAHGKTDYGDRDTVEDTDNAQYYAEQAAASKDAAGTSATGAAASADAASKSETAAKDAQTAAEAAQGIAEEAKAAAQASQQAAKTSEDNSLKWSKYSESYAHGKTDYGDRDTVEDTDNAQYYAEQAAASKEAADTSASAAAGSATEASKSEAAAKEAQTAAQGSKDAAEKSANAAAGSATAAADSAKTAQSIAQGQKGYFATSAALKEKYPTGADGDWAIVGETDTIWVWDSDTSTWTNSGNKVDLSNYYTKADADAKLSGKSDTSHTHNYAGSTSAGGPANSAVIPEGFQTKGTASWGSQTGSWVTSWQGKNDSQIQFRQDCPSNGQLSVLVDGEFYAAEGNKKVYHQGDVIPVSDGGTGANNAAAARNAIGAAPAGNYVTIQPDGVSEIGQFLDFHKPGSSNSDYDARLQYQFGSKQEISLPSSSGTLCLEGHTHSGYAPSDHTHSQYAFQTGRVSFSFDGAFRSYSLPVSSNEKLFISIVITDNSGFATIYDNLVTYVQGTTVFMTYYGFGGTEMSNGTIRGYINWVVFP